MPVEPVGMPGYIAAFGAAADAANFMVERGETSWEFKLIWCLMAEVCALIKKESWFNLEKLMKKILFCLTLIMIE